MRPVGELGDTRWKVLLQLKTWLRILQCCLSLLMMLPCFLFSGKARVFVKGTDISLNITVQFPFHTDNSTVSYSGQDEPSKFAFDPQLEISAWVYFAVAMVTLLVAILMLGYYITIYGCNEVNNVYMADIIISAVTSLVLLISTSFWLYYLVGMTNAVEKEILSAYAELDASGICRPKAKCVKKLPHFSSLYISIGAAYLNALVCIVNALFLYKALSSPFNPNTLDDGQQNALVVETELEASSSDHSK